MRIDFVLTWKKVALATLAAIFAALAISFSGLISIAASSGHFAVTRWFLGWTMENAVETQSVLVRIPKDLDLDDPALIQRAAGHFATGCAACHGGPGVPQSPVVEEMTPAPPRLEEALGDWSNEELFWIVKHGIKYSGMPAWPTQARDDEVWAQVAFLRALPSMDAETYAELALGGARGQDRLEAGGETTAALDGIFQNALDDCARCHSRDGLGRGEGATEDAFPVIAGQPEPYLFATLQAFAFGIRHSGFMQPPAKRYDEAMLARLAQWYSTQPPAGPAVAGARRQAEQECLARPSTPLATAIPTDQGSDGTESPAVERNEPASAPDVSWQDEAGRLEGDADVLSFAVPSAAAAGPPDGREELLDLGRRIALEGHPARKVPSCQSCHGTAGREKNSRYPYLSGQPEWYLAEHLQLFKEDKRGGTEYAHIMAEIAKNLTEEQIDAVAAWYAEQPLR
ncbi:MAG: c-type cytochrome [Aurantimonas coralicida]